MGRLEGKVAMITGAGGEHGLGRAIARRFAAYITGQSINVTGGGVMH